MKLFILLSMLFLHVIADYNLQGWLAQSKQKDYWKDYDEFYKNDYIIALFMHSFSWSFMILIPLFIYTFNNQDMLLITCGLCLINTVIHMIVDNEKANRLTINLVMDQCIHIIQIVLSWLFIILLL